MTTVQLRCLSVLVLLSFSLSSAFRSIHSLSPLHAATRLQPDLLLRGGDAQRSGSAAGGAGGLQQSPWSKARATFLDIQPATRAHLSLVLFTTLVNLVGLPAPEMFALIPSKIIPQIWRPVTAVTYLGTPSMWWANNLYFLLKFGQALERSTGSDTHAWFLMVQTVLLSSLGVLFNFPFQAKSLIAAVLYAWSRLNPLQPMNFQFGIQISAWHLPFCLAAIDCLSQQSLAGAWPHVMGALTAHVFVFFRNIWPQYNDVPNPNSHKTTSGKYSRLAVAKVFQTPQWLSKYFNHGNDARRKPANGGTRYMLRPSPQ